MPKVAFLLNLKIISFIIVSLGTLTSLNYTDIANSQPSPTLDNLNPSPNLLEVPTKTESVQIKRTQPITLEQALELAQRNHRQLQAAILTRKRSQAALREARAAKYPTASLQSSLTRTQFTDPASTKLDGGVELSYDLYTSGKRSATIGVAEARLRFDELEVQRLWQQIRLDITNTYYDLQQADGEVEIGEAAVREGDRSVRDAQLLEKAGLSTNFDILRSRVQLAQANQDLTSAKNQQKIARRQLVQLLSLGNTVDVSAADPVRPAGSWDLSLEQSIILALSNRGELEQQLTQRQIGQQEQKIAISAIKPQINLFASYGVKNYDEYQEIDNGLNFNDELRFGVKARWDFWDGGATQARVEQQELNQAIAETSFADSRNQIRFEVERAYLNLNSSQENIQTASQSVTEAEESLRLARLRFNAGAGTQTDVINAQSELIRTRINRLRAIIDYNRGLAALNRAISQKDAR